MEQFLGAIDWKQILNVLISWLLFSVGLWTVLGKLRWKKRWMAWVPGLRYIALSEILDMEREGLVCAVLDILAVAASILNVEIFSERVQVALTLIALVVIVTLYVYRIRLCLRLLRLFGLRKRWLWLWIPLSFLYLIPCLGILTAYMAAVMGLFSLGKKGRKTSPFKNTNSSHS